MSRTVHLHVGIAKTGTTYLQRRLFANRVQLRRHGTLYPGAGPAAHFLGSLDLRGTGFKGHVYGGAQGAWGRLVAAADEFDGTTLISHETLARAKPDQIERAVTGFSTEDVRVVVTARDLGRQLPAVWQETLKNRSVVAYDDYLAGVFRTWPAENRPGGGFWAAQDLGALLQRWSAVVGPDRVTVVTVPSPSAAADELWHRFVRAAELPTFDYVEPSQGANTSLGVAEAELLRRLNPLLETALDWPAYDARIKRALAEGVLSPVASAGRLSLPRQWKVQAREVADAQIASVQAAAVRIVGELDELIPVFEEPAPDAPWRQPSDLSEAELLDAALRALAALVAAPTATATGAGPTGEHSSALAQQVRSLLRKGAAQARRRVSRGRL